MISGCEVDDSLESRYLLGGLSFIPVHVRYAVVDCRHILLI